MLGKFILRRLLVGALTVFIIVSCAFVLLRIVPGDPVDIWLGDYATLELREQVTRKWGLDEPLYQQYLIFLGKLARGDLGISLRSGMPVVDLIKEVYPYTVRLMVGSVLIGVLLGMVLGTYAAARQNTLFDATAMVSSFMFISMPSFVLAYILLWLLAVEAGLFPIIESETPGHYSTYFQCLALPCLAIGLRTTGLVSRMVRSTMVEVLNEEYIRTARSKGLSERVVLYKHALRNTLAAVISLVGVQMIIMLGGVVVPETVFSRPGLGRLYFRAVLARDYPLIQGCIFIIAIAVICVNLIVDISYGAIDPRVRYD